MRAILSSLSMNRMASIPEMLESTGRPSLWGKIRSLKEKYMLFSVTWRRSETCCLERWSVGFWILSVALVTASCIGIRVYRDTTSKLHGYGSSLFVVRSPAWIHLKSSRLLSKWAGTFFSIGLRALARSQEMRWVGPLMLDTIGRILISGPALWVLTRW